MAVWNIVNRTDFRSHANIMAEHYQLERIRAEEYLKSISRRITLPMTCWQTITFATLRHSGAS